MMIENREGTSEMRSTTRGLRNKRDSLIDHGNHNAISAIKGLETPKLNSLARDWQFEF